MQEASVDHYNIMSRRTRIKHGRAKQRFTLSHHSEYAVSSTYFPKSYSLFGKDIFFPTSVMPLLSNNKINYVGEMDDMQHSLQSLQTDLSQVTTVSISVPGVKCQEGSPITNFMVFCTSMVCFCINPVLRTTTYRDKFFPKYTFHSYEALANIIRKFSHCQTLVINFQDNLMTKQKMELIDDAFFNSDIKTVVFRNLTYFIEVEELEGFFHRMRNKRGVDFKFIWETYSMISDRQAQGGEQECSLNSMSEEVL